MKYRVRAYKVCAAGLQHEFGLFGWYQDPDQDDQPCIEADTWEQASQKATHWMAELWCNRARGRQPLLLESGGIYLAVRGEDDHVLNTWGDLQLAIKQWRDFRSDIYIR